MGGDSETAGTSTDAPSVTMRDGSGISTGRGLVAISPEFGLAPCWLIQFPYTIYMLDTRTVVASQNWHRY